MTEDRVRGVYAAAATPITADGLIDAPRFAAHCAWILQKGAHGVCPFGTTGEGIAFPADSRKKALEEIVSSGIPPTQLIPATGSCAPMEVVDLASHAEGLGCTGVLVMPPFYFKDPSHEGVYRFYAGVIDHLGDNAPQVWLYNIPQLTGVEVSLEVVTRLLAAYPGIVTGIKDSWGKLDHTLAYVEAFPEIAIFTGTDSHIVDTMRAGGAGTITGMGNVNPLALREIFDMVGSPKAAELCETAGRIHMIVESYGGVPAMKSIMAAYRGDPAWAGVLPPLVALSPERVDLLIKELEAGAYVHPDRTDFW